MGKSYAKVIAGPVPVMRLYDRSLMPEVVPSYGQVYGSFKDNSMNSWCIIYTFPNIFNSHI